MAEERARRVGDERLAEILRGLRRELAQILGEQMEEMYLFGSQARGDARADSDIDVLIVLRGEFDYMDLIRRTSQAVADISLQYDTVVSRVFISRDEFLHEKSAFLRNVRREAVAVA